MATVDCKKLNEMVMSTIKGIRDASQEAVETYGANLSEATGLSQRQCERLVFWGSRIYQGKTQQTMYRYTLHEVERDPDNSLPRSK